MNNDNCKNKNRISKVFDKVKNLFFDWFPEILIGLIVIILTAFIAYGFSEQRKQNEWYKSLTVDEKAEYDAQQAAKKENNILRYEVISVSKYIKNTTNRFGGIVDTEVCYTFQYLDNGVLKNVTDFTHHEHGLSKVIIGDTDMYIIDNNSLDQYRYLQLSEETLKKLTG